MGWRGEVHVDQCLLLYRGAAGDNAVHRHASVQICQAETPLSMLDASGKTIQGHALLVRPDAPHQLLPTSTLTLLLVEPQSALGQIWMQKAGDADICRLPESERLDLSLSLSDLNAQLHQGLNVSESNLDPRLAHALAYLHGQPLNGAVTRAAQHAGISVSRLRTLAKQQLGVPLSKWVLWQAIRVSAKQAMSMSLAEAALAGGFADQAHFTRSARKLFGLTPTQLLQAASG
ncbi:hypothetical protein GCM10008090_00890 [Arenicella chitinivorans]|uniref:HTH araC/xylS-type domain-containing protein n=1 Tax=Arenicella chitinivorans TaxID=1329800 RepID=A0A918VH80_9GAMM|nr:helix-turn-helix domain-containing protein [Arenicella chitinivorans]GGZ96481.1 hypothetical protein GCM10008090_00890 [Arenicella chitinivorans]